MVFSSFPTYPDPSNWQQQPITTTVGITGNNNNQQFIHHPQPPLHQPQPPQQLPPLPHGGGGGGGPGSSGAVRPGSMAERARMANIPMPEAALKCPRCESTNTKFCYFNNYSLSQPRHFCKTCRRYWTRGGALRSVPVGGGCRRNKRTKSGGGGGSSSNSGAKSQDSNTSNNNNNNNTSSDQYHRSPMGPTSSLSSILSSYNTGLLTAHHHDHILGLGSSSLPPLKLMPPLDPHHHFTNTDNFTLQYGAVSAPLGASSAHHHHPDLTAFQIASGGGGGGASGLLTGFEQWRFPATQLPLLGGLEISSPSGLYPFDQTDPGYGVTGSGQFRAKNIFQNLPSSSSSSSSAAALVTAAASQIASVKVEDNNNNNNNNQDQLSLSRQLLGAEQLWNNASAATTSSWSDVSNFSSSSTSNPL